MDNIIVNIIKKEPFVGKDGFNYILVTKEILTPRRTYIKGTFTGKYRGEKIPDDYEKSDLFDFSIYEAEVLCNSIDDFSKNKPFIFPNDFKNFDKEKKIKGKVFPKEKLPLVLPVIVSANETTFGINVLEPKIFEFEPIRKFHQTDGDEIFGMFNAFITGYVIDYERTEVEKVIGPIIIVDPPPPTIKPCMSNGIKTGNFKRKGNNIRYEYYCKHHPDTVWKWEYTEVGPGPTLEPKSGCLSNILGLIGILLFTSFLITILPWLLYFIGFFIIIFFIGLIAPYLKWIFRIIGVLILITFIGTLIETFNNSSRRYSPNPILQDTERERQDSKEPIVSNENIDKNKTDNKDYYITKYREWKDYDGIKYKGYYKLKQSDITKAGTFKNNLSISQSNLNSYDKIVFSLKENDKNKLDGLYKLFDSIQSKNKLSKIKFAEMIVSFVQDIPYTLILENDCNPNLYSDSFTRSYLSSKEAKCEGYQKFGINTPVEFLYNLNGDCDTRTLLLYTIFSHYDYDVALMSSEFYSHSILGINLPIDGLAYQFQDKNYILWETTQANVKPGIISNQISNLNNWRISLKSK